MWANFEIDEFRCRCGCVTNLIKPSFIDKMQLLRDAYGRAIRIASGYRCPTHDMAVRQQDKTGPHVTGFACDPVISRADLYEVIHHAFALGFTGVGVKAHDGRHQLHLDTLTGPDFPRPTIWTYD